MTLVAVGALATVLVPARAALAWPDVPKSYWDYSAINWVSQTKPWMRDYSDGDFHPTALEQRNYLARTLVQMWATTPYPSCSISFADLKSSDPFYQYACLAVKWGWMQKSGSNFNPLGSIKKQNFDQALILAMGLSEPAQGLANIHMDNGTKYSVSSTFPYVQLALTLGLHVDHSSDESENLMNSTAMPRDEVAYSLWMAKDQDPSWEIAGTSQFDTVSLTNLDPSKSSTQKVKQQVTQFALNYVGYPYIWGGEWYKKSPAGYCCGYQPEGGFDCSGFVWWVLKQQGQDGYDPTVRPYAGWSLTDRTTYEMAEHTKTKISFSDLRVGDIMLFADSGSTGDWHNVDHAGIYLGNGWMINSTDAGVQLEWVGTGSYWRSVFAWGRRLIPVG